MRLLALDNSTHTGAAFWVAPDKRPVCWTWHLRAADKFDIGTRTWQLMGLLDAFLDVQQAARTPVEAIAFEEPFLPFKMSSDTFQTQVSTLKLLISLGGTVETVAKKWGIRCVEVSTQQAKIALVGYGRKPKDAPPTFNWKKEMRNAATRQGYTVADDNQADAIAVGKVAFRHLCGIEVL
jgi:Holliday junction resolvasome RuvABC endonuclease subunit